MAFQWNPDEFRKKQTEWTSSLKNQSQQTGERMKQGAKQAAQGFGEAVKNWWDDFGKTTKEKTTAEKSAEAGPQTARPEFSYQNGDFQQVYDQIMGQKDFSFDLNGSALYNQLKDTYVKQAQLGLQNAMGQAAAQSGGYGSSYAQAAGQQAYQQSLEGLNKQIPSLYAMELQKRQMDNDQLAQKYGMLADDRDFAYQKWRAENADWENDRDYGRAVYESDRAYDRGVLESDRSFNENKRQFDASLGYQYDALWQAQRQWQSEFDYGKERDQVMDARYADETAYNRSIDQRNFDWEQEKYAGDDAFRREQMDRNDKQFYASLEQEDRHHSADLGFKYAGLEQEDRHHSDDLGFKYAGLEQEDRHHSADLGFKYADLEQADKHHNDSIALSYAGLTQDNWHHQDDMDYKYSDLAAQITQWGVQNGLDVNQLKLAYAQAGIPYPGSTGTTSTKSTSSTSTKKNTNAKKNTNTKKNTSTKKKTQTTTKKKNTVDTSRGVSNNITGLPRQIYQMLK